MLEILHDQGWEDRGGTQPGVIVGHLCKVWLNLGDGVDACGQNEAASLWSRS